jgi:hypothetical protein
MTQIATPNSGQAEQEFATIFTRNDRLSVILVMMMVVFAISAGLLLQQQTSNQTTNYESRTAGISARYPAGWLVDERGNYVARIRDPKARPFKTQFTIAVVPSGGQTTTRNVLDAITIQRSADLAAYRVLSIEDVAQGGTPQKVLRFAYVDADPNPFIQRLPVVVLGLDIVIPNGNRSIVLTYMADQATFENQRPTFDRFVASVRY